MEDVIKHGLEVVLKSGRVFQASVMQDETNMSMVDGKMITRCLFLVHILNN